MLRNRAVTGLFIFPALLLAQQANRGIAPRPAAQDYAAQGSTSGVTYAAALLPSAQVKKLFAFDISKDYVVFEVAAYPASGSNAEITADDFLLRPAKSGEPVRPSDPTTVASAIQQKNLPKRGSESSPTVVAGTEVGYESGRDPYTGQRVHGTYTSTGVGVGVGGDPGPPRMPSPGGYPQDRELLENQLWDKMLPDGHFDRAVAGYLYFPSSLLKKRSNGMYELEYLGNGEKVKLEIPAK
ncbi:MAG TPA: hypothetical protein VKX25_22405 [Bryobacteraceae bacterium]|nr:hypothetical protein [Bryobacteraceae bacterium]